MNHGNVMSNGRKQTGAHSLTLNEWESKRDRPVKKRDYMKMNNCVNLFGSVFVVCVYIMQLSFFANAF